MNLSNLVFIGIMGILSAALLTWGIKKLPGERWQIMAAVPKKKDRDGAWTGVNLTYYGFFTANAYVTALTLFLVLMGSVHIPISGSVIFGLTLIGVCMPASRLIARIVEGKAHTFTVGGASFAGLVLAPPAIVMLNLGAGRLGVDGLPFMETLAAMAAAYAIGEGLGRLACISFGCCYGKPLENARPFARRLFNGAGCVFWGKTRKAAYESGLEGIPLIPVQAITAVLYTVVGIISAGLFLSGSHAAAFLFAILATQLWRAFSETMRADFRGGGRMSRYQVMALAAVPLALLLAGLSGDPAHTERSVDVVSGVRILWNPAVIFLLQGLWIASFLYTGRSMVTGSRITFHVERDRI